MRKSIKKNLMFYIAMAAMMALPMTSFAQDGFFGSAHGTSKHNEGAPMFQNRGLGDGQDAIGTQGFGQEPAPVGSGVFMLIAAGAGYALLKSKKNK